MGVETAKDKVLSPATTPGATPQGDDAESPSRPAHILVLDDESFVRSVISAALGQHGYAVESVNTLHEAREALKRSSFDLVICDIVLQDGSGISLLAQLRVQQPQLPVIMITAIHDISVAMDAMRRGAYDYLLKPLDHDLLIDAVLRALEHREVVQESHKYRMSLERLVEARTEMLHQAMKELEHSYDITLEALGDALDLKDSETEGHSKRVTAYTVALGRAMRLDPASLKVIARGAFLHDIGKMAIPDSILRKPGELSPDEQERMREHCTRGYQILRKIPFLKEAAEIVFSHQEHFDGSGYPNRLRGKDIPMGARVFAIADALDAITSDRPYRKARSFEAAQQEIARCSGSQFDPAVVEVFLAIPTELWQQLRFQVTDRFSGTSSFGLSHVSSPQAFN